MSARDVAALRLGGGIQPSSYATDDPAAAAALSGRRAVVLATSGRYPTWAEDVQFVAGFVAGRAAR